MKEAKRLNSIRSGVGEARPTSRADERGEVTTEPLSAKVSLTTAYEPTEIRVNLGAVFSISNATCVLDRQG